MSIADRLRKNALRVFECPPDSGVKFWLKPIVSKDMLNTHKSFLLAVLPPSQEDMILLIEAEEIAKEAAAGSDEARQRLKELDRLMKTQLVKATTDPDMAANAWDFNVACLQASVVGVSEGDGPMSAARIVIDASEADDTSVPELVPLDALGTAVISALVDEIRSISFGGKGGAEAISRFR